MTHPAAHRVLHGALCVCVLIALAAVSPTAQQKPEVALKAAIDKEVVDGDLKSAIGMYRTLAASADRAVAAQALLRMGQCYEKLGAAQSAEARKAYAAVAAEFGDQSAAVAAARARLAAIGAVAPADGPVHRRIWPTEGGVEWNRISPDGRLVAGIDDETGDLVMRQVSTGAVRRLTDIPKDRAWLDYADSPIWSRDGHRLACTWAKDDRSASNPAVLRVTDVEKGTARVLSINSRFRLIWLHDFSPSGGEVLASVQESGGLEKGSLAWVSTADGSVRIVREFSVRFGPIEAFASPDGNWIAYRNVPRSYGYDETLAVVPTSGGNATPVVSNSYDSRLVGWTPDGQHVVFLARRSDGEELMAVRVHQGKPVEPPVSLRPITGRMPLGLTSSGSLLYRSVRLGTSTVHKGRLDVASGAVTGLTRVTQQGVDWASGPSWSPDGKRLAYVSFPYRRAARTLSVWSADRNQTRSFSLDFDAKTTNPTTWSADGRWIYVEGLNAAKASGVFRVDADTGVTEPVLSPDSGEFPEPDFATTYSSLAGWTSDGATLLKRVNQRSDQLPRPVVLLEHRVTGHTEREIFRTASGVGLSFVALNRDGSKIAVVLHESGPSAKRRLVVMASAGGPPTTLIEFSGPGNHITFPRWSADGRSVLFVFRPDYETPAELWMVDVGNGARKRYTVPMDRWQELALSPDGLEVAFIGGPREKDEGVWLLENFLPTSKGPAVSKTAAPTAKK